MSCMHCIPVHDTVHEQRCLALQVTMRRLDRLRSVKNRMVRLNTRVETVS